MKSIDKFINRIINDDCLKVMSEFSDDSIDMILCDLPYGITNCDWDSVIPLDELWKQYKRIIKNNGAIVLTSSQPFTSKLIMSCLEMFKYELIWEKSIPTGMATSSFMPMKYHENICVFVKEGKPTFNKQMAERSKSGKVRARTPIQGNPDKSHHVKMGNVNAKQYNPNKVNPKSILKFNSVPNSKGKLHPTQKPVTLFEYLIKTYTNENDLVLDNCIGSGTTAVACKRLNRNFIGIEIDVECCEIANKRLSKTKKEIVSYKDIKLEEIII